MDKSQRLGVAISSHAIPRTHWVLPYFNDLISEIYFNIGYLFMLQQRLPSCDFSLFLTVFLGATHYKDSSNVFS